MPRHATAFAGALLVGASVAAGQDGLRAVALTGDPAPGVAGATFQGFGLVPVLNDAGRAAFTATLSVSPTDGIWSEGSGSLVRVVSDGAVAPGTAGAMFTGLGATSLLLSNGGNVAFRASLTGGDVDFNNFHGIWAQNAGALQLAARNRGPAPGMPPGVYGMSTADPLLMGGNNGLLFIATTLVAQPPESYVAAYSGVQGSIMMAARTRVPGQVPSGFLSLGPPLLINDGGVLSLNARSFFPGGQNQGIHTGPGGGLLPTVTSATETMVIPGVYFGPQFGGKGINNGGDVAFESNLVDENGFTIPNPSSLWLIGATDRHLIARQGQAVPGGGGALFSAMTGVFVLGDGGNVVFVAQLTGPGVDPTNNQCIMLWSREGGLRMAARLSDAPPGLPGVTITSFYGSLALNALGQFATAVTLSAQGPTAYLGGDMGVYRYIIYRQGVIVPVRPGLNLRVATNLPGLLPSGGSDGRGRSFNDRGEVVFRGSWTSTGDPPQGGQGVFVATVPRMCPADFNRDGFVTGEDFDVYARAFELGDASSDFDRDGFVTGLDFDAFVVAFELGC